MENIGEDVVFVVVGDVKDFYCYLWVNFGDFLGNGVCYYVGIIGYGVVKDGDVIFLIICCLFEVFFDDLCWVIVLDYVVGGGNYFYW